MTSQPKYIYKLDECLEWILYHGFKRLVLQFKHDDLKHSVDIVEQLKEAYNGAATKKEDGESNRCPLDLYVSQSNTCCVDLIVTQHVSDVDAIIHFGNVCLSKPHIENKEIEKPVLFMFEFLQDNKSIEEEVQSIHSHIQTICSDDQNLPVLVLYDTSLIGYVRRLRDKLDETNVEVALLNCQCTNWEATKTNRSMLNHQNQESDQLIGHYIFSKPLSHYKSTIYVGDRLSINLTLHGPSNLWRINCPTSFELEQVKVSKILNKRMALVHRLRDEEDLKIGVIITNPLPNITDMISRLENYAKARNHTLYFISMIQTIDECKIGNFDLCDAFVVINSCTCSTILESLVFNRPILNCLEYKLACGFEAEYGRVLWPRSESHLSAEDMINKREVSDVSLALVHTRNQLLERCSLSRANMWSGLDYKATINSDEGIIEGGESLNIEDGLQGIASTYESEPLKKSGLSSQSSAVNPKN